MKSSFKKVNFSEVDRGQHFFDMLRNEYVKIRPIKVDQSEFVKGEDPRVNCLFYKYNDGRNGFMLGTLHFVPTDCDEVFIKDPV